jgi:siroheme synthase (precorrin-2 oxidase/ferrochelatase)
MAVNHLRERIAGLLEPVVEALAAIVEKCSGMQSIWLGRPIVLHPETNQAIYTPVMKSRAEAMADGHWMNRAFADAPVNTEIKATKFSQQMRLLAEEDFKE